MGSTTTTRASRRSPSSSAKSSNRSVPDLPELPLAFASRSVSFLVVASHAVARAHTNETAARSERDRPGRRRPDSAGPGAVDPVAGENRVSRPAEVAGGQGLGGPLLPGSRGLETSPECSGAPASEPPEDPLAPLCYERRRRGHV